MQSVSVIQVSKFLTSLDKDTISSSFSTADAYEFLTEMKKLNVDPSCPPPPCGLKTRNRRHGMRLLDWDTVYEFRKQGKHCTGCDIRTRDCRICPDRKWILCFSYSITHNARHFLKATHQDVHRFYGRWRFISIFTTACHWILSWASLVQSSPHPHATFT
jgi:hypothetical protein